MVEHRAYGGRNKERDNIWWHGSVSGDMRGGKTGLHLGTRAAAEDALHATIGFPAEGTWDGTRNYYKTLLAGKKRIEAMNPYGITGRNVDAPDEDYYAHDHPKGILKYSNGDPVPMDVKPSIKPFKITGSMTNAIDRPHADFKANGYMQAALKKGNAKNGYFYKNDGEDYGSISAVVPGPGHIQPVDESEITKAEGGEVDEPGITAYHGSPHDFERFDMSKIGTGEGNQSYGHGLYFAENEPVAKGYRDNLSEGTYKTDTGEIFDPYKNLEHMNVRVAAYKGIDPAIERAQGILQSDPHDDRVRRDLKKLYALKDKNAAPHKGHMYEVHINAHPDHFLDWDKPISEQSEHVQKAIKHIAGQLDIDPFEHLALAAVVGQHPRSQTYSPRGEDLHTDIDEILGGKEHALEALHAAGIKGIRYLDAGSRPDGAYALHISHKGAPYTDPIPMKTFQQAQNHAKEYAAKGYDTKIKENGSRNYVVFDDKLVNVKRRYEKGGIVQGEAPIHALHLTSKFGNSLPSAVNQAKAATRRRP